MVLLQIGGTKAVAGFGMTTKYNVWELLEMAESVKPPDFNDDYYHDIEFPAKDGWKVVIFYDCGELDYITHFINPEGDVIDFWEWPGDAYNHTAKDFNSDKNILINWRGVGDLKRMKEIEAKK